MKLLLTSAGLTNKILSDTLFEMVGKKPEDTTLAFIPTAATGMDEEDWLVADLVGLRNKKFKEVIVTDISKVPEDVWRPQLERADVLFFEGGDNYRLMEWINKSGLNNALPELLETRVWVGVSAGSMVTNKDMQLPILQDVFEENVDKKENIEALGFVDFYFIPHLNSEYFSKVRKENIEKAIAGIKEKIYAVDDNGAVKSMNGKVEIITEGEYLEFN